MVCMLLLIIHSIMLHFVRVNCCIIKMWLQKSGQLATANIMANAYSHLCTHVHIYTCVCVCLYVTEGIHVQLLDFVLTFSII